MNKLLRLAASTLLATGLAAQAPITQADGLSITYSTGHLGHIFPYLGYRYSYDYDDNYPRHGNYRHYKKHRHNRYCRNDRRRGHHRHDRYDDHHDRHHYNRHSDYDRRHNDDDRRYSDHDRDRGGRQHTAFKRVDRR